MKTQPNQLQAIQHYVRENGGFEEKGSLGDTKKYWRLIDEATKDKPASFEFVKHHLSAGEFNDRVIAADLSGQLCNPIEPEDEKRAVAIAHLLVKAAESEKDYAVLGRVADSLRFMNPAKKVIAATKKLTYHPDEDVHFFASRSFGSLLDKDYATDENIDRLIELSADKDPDVRDWATSDLSSLIDVWEIDQPKIRDALLARVKDRHNDTRAEAFWGLAGCKDERGVAPFKEYLEKSKSIGTLDIRAAAYWGNEAFYEPLLAIQKWWKLGDDEDYDDDPIDTAIRSCSANPMDRFVMPKTPQDVADSLNFSGDDTSWFDEWHHHFDWNGWGNRDWEVRQLYLEQLFQLYHLLCKKLASYPKDYQVWVQVDDFDSMVDQVDIHTPNPNKNNFPFRTPQLKKPVYTDKKLQTLLEKQGLTVMMWEEDSYRTYFLYDTKVGTPIY